MAKPAVVFVLGGPGAGKGTECAKIVKEFDFVHLSAGDLLREERKAGGEQATLIDNYIKEGKIIPVAITINLIKIAMEKAGKKGKMKFLIDGFPRNADNLQGWNEIMDDVCDVKFTLYLECTEEVMTTRILGRNEGRADDNAEALKKRFHTYKNETMPIIKIFDKQGMTRLVDSTGTEAQVHAACQEIFAQFQPVTVTYFDGPGRGEIVRLALAAGGVDFKDNRIKQSEWPEIKADPNSLPNKCFSSLPILSQGVVNIAQSQACATWAADMSLHKKFTPLQRAKVGMFLGAHADVQSNIYKCLFGTDESKAAGKANLPAALKPLLDGLEKNLPASGFLVGKLSLGDLAVFDLVTNPFPGLRAMGIDLAPYPKITALVDAVGKDANVKAYTAKRGF